MRDICDASCLGMGGIRVDIQRDSNPRGMVLVSVPRDTTGVAFPI